MQTRPSFIIGDYGNDHDMVDKDTQTDLLCEPIRYDTVKSEPQTEAPPRTLDECVTILKSEVL